MRALALVVCVSAVSVSVASAAIADDAAGNAAGMPMSAAMRSDAGARSGAPMLMADTERFGRVIVDQLEWRHAGERDAAAWDAEAWYGSDRNKLWMRTQGERSGAETENARGELLWDRALGRWWNLQAGAREDFGRGPPRTWAAFGIAGLAPYRVDIEATLYVGVDGRTAARLKAEHDVLLTQRLILQPEIELNAYGREDPARHLDSGLADAEIGLRLRYEIRRELAPYIGVAWTRQEGATPRRGAGAAETAPPRPSAASQVQFVAGVRAWL